MDLRWKGFELVVGEGTRKVREQELFEQSNMGRTHEEGF